MISNFPPFDPCAPFGKIDDVISSERAAQTCKNALHRLADRYPPVFVFNHVNSFRPPIGSRPEISHVEKAFPKWKR